MKNKFFSLGIITTAFIAGFFLLANFTLAYDTSNIQGFLESTRGGTGLTISSIFSVIGKLISGLVALVGAFFVALIIYGGITWLTSTGDSGKIEKAKKTITYAVIGVIVVLSAWNLTTFVITTIQSAPSGMLTAPPSSGGTGTGGTSPTCAGLTAANSTFACKPIADCCTKQAYLGLGTTDFGSSSTCGDTAYCKEADHQTCYERTGTFSDCTDPATVCCQKITDQCAACSITNCGGSGCPDCHRTIGANGLPICTAN